MEDKTQLKRDIDLELIGALGEPAYWRFASNGPRPDEGANRWEMKTRNRGEDFVRNRLRQLARIVADRDATAIVSGLTGHTVEDEAYKGKRSDESRTATGLTSPRFTDSALAWCACGGSHRSPSSTDSQGPPSLPGRSRLASSLRSTWCSRFLWGPYAG